MKTYSFHVTNGSPQNVLEIFTVLNLITCKTKRMNSGPPKNETKNIRNAMGQPEIEPKTEQKSCPNLARVYPRSTPSRPETTQKRPGLTLGGPKRKKLKKYIFEQKLVSKRSPPGADFESFHYMKLRKQGFEGVATTRAHVKKVTFSIGRY